MVPCVSNITKMSSTKYLSYLKNNFKNKNCLNISRNFCTGGRQLILGIETSCDDTGCAIVDSCGNVLGDALYSQQSVHLNNGGIIPPIAQQLHRENIEETVNKAVKKACISIHEVAAIATTVKPGLPLSLVIGMKYGKYLSRIYQKPFIPIHHMEAHALTARMVDPTIEFPFLCLLISGGHCLLVIVKSVDEFLLLGESIDDAPGEAFDKLARRLKLRNLPEFRNLSGGQAVELAATCADDPLEFNFKLPMTKYRDCMFSMAGLKNKALKHIIRQEVKHNIVGDGVIPGLYNLCAGFQLAITRHLCHRTQRAIEFASRTGLLIKPCERTLVVSGGAACNDFIFEGLKLVCDAKQYRIIRAPPKLCTDNGIMIAWNGVERWREQKGIATYLDEIDIEPKAPLGKNICEEVAKADLKCDWVKLTSLIKKKICNEQ